MPEEGIVIALTGFFDKKLTLDSNVFLVNIIADGLPHPEGHLHLMHNEAYAKRLPRSLFISHWPQPHLIPRSSKRKNLFENVCFFGEPYNLWDELSSEQWIQRLKNELGINFIVREASLWHDYSDVDCALAIRKLPKSRHLHKPATKLYNAWLAGVPFIGGNESAYTANGHPNKDYLVATSLEEAFQHLKHLKEDESFRSFIVQNGHLSGEAFTQEATLARWKKILQEVVPPLARKWQQKSRFKRCCFFITQHLFCFIDYCRIVFEYNVRP